MHHVHVLCTSIHWHAPMKTARACMHVCLVARLKTFSSKFFSSNHMFPHWHASLPCFFHISTQSFLAHTSLETQGITHKAFESSCSTHWQEQGEWATVVDNGVNHQVCINLPSPCLSLTTISESNLAHSSTHQNSPAPLWAQWKYSTMTAKTAPPPLKSRCWLKGFESDKGHYQPRPLWATAHRAEGWCALANEESSDERDEMSSNRQWQWRQHPPLPLSAWMISC